ncbi:MULTISPECIES: hypothetical protein [unclassified Mesorhizobium]|uniref:hypothetical protein n=1 Tax=unclassified Mesorhizobium TaxID=325217 RepID=UPI00333BFFF8
MSNRYATIITDDDGREVVSAIGVFEGTASQARIGRVEPVVPGVLIGMVRGGPVDAVGGFGFPRGTHDGRAIALARATLKAAPAGKRHAPAADAARKAPPKRSRAKSARRKSGKIKSGKIKRARPAKQAKQAATAEPAGISDHG